MKPVHEHNRRAWDQRARGQDRHATAASNHDFSNPMDSVDPYGWLPRPLAGRRVLCLAAGGGRQGPLLAAAGGDVTVVDLSAEMLRLDRETAVRHGLRLRTIEASMDDVQALGDGSFDIVLQPVSTCYIPDLGRTYREVARVLASGGLYVSKHKQPGSLQASLRPAPTHYVLSTPYDHAAPLPTAEPGFHREAGTLEFLHRWGELLGGLCRAGFSIEDVMEPDLGDPGAEPGSFAHRCRYVAPYIELKARRIDRPAPSSPGTPLWTPPAR